MWHLQWYNLFIMKFYLQTVPIPLPKKKYSYNMFVFIRVGQIAWIINYLLYKQFPFLFLFLFFWKSCILPISTEHFYIKILCLILGSFYYCWKFSHTIHPLTCSFCDLFVNYKQKVNYEFLFIFICRNWN